MFIDIKDFLIITKDQFNSLLEFLEIPLTPIDNTYAFTYLFCNLFAYILIFFILNIIKILYFEYWKPRKTSW